MRGCGGGIVDSGAGNSWATTVMQRYTRARAKDWRCSRSIAPCRYVCSNFLLLSLVCIATVGNLVMVGKWIIQFFGINSVFWSSMRLASIDYWQMMKATGDIMVAVDYHGMLLSRSLNMCVTVTVIQTAPHFCFFFAFSLSVI
jgi:hypothetical protein